METPICDFVRAYRDRAALRLHMPGHKGLERLGAEPLDITEIDGADVLYHADGIIRQSEANAAALFGTAKTLYSAEGSSLSIRAMLYLARLYGEQTGRAPRILAGRNAHKVFVTAAALLDLEVDWLYPEEERGLISCPISPQGLERSLRELETSPVAVYVTSPDYLGNRADLRGLAEVCHRYGTLLLVDNAHGAYLRFLPRSEHPIDLGADACCDSAHKTLPALTGAGYLHISRRAPALFSDMAACAMSLFASTSPSYLILQSLDALNRYLAEGYAEGLADFEQQVSRVKTRLCQKNLSLVGEEPLKLTIAAKSYGYTGQALSEALARQGLVCEFSDPDFAVMMLTPELGADGLARIERTLTDIPQREPLTAPMPPLPRPEGCLSPRAALLAVSREIPVFEALGQILAAPTVACPPAIPILVCGERVDEAAIQCFRYYGITHCRVVENGRAFQK